MAANHPANPPTADTALLIIPPWVVRRLVYPGYELFSGRRILAKWRELESTQYLPQAEIEKHQWLKLQKLLKQAYANTAFYRERFDQAGIKPEQIQTPADMERIPPLTRQDLLANPTRLRAKNIDRDRIKPNATGGSSGEPVRFYNERYELDYRSAAVLRNYRWAGLEVGAPQATIWGSPIDATAAETFGGKLSDLLLNRRFFKAFDLRLDRLLGLLQQIRQAKPHVITGYTSILAALAQAVLELAPGYQIEGLQSLVASAETLLPEQRQLIQRAFGRPVFNRYGCREGGAIAQECEQGGLHINAENIYLEVVEDGRPLPAGRSGEIALTMLNNRGFPFIRYLVGDAGRLSASACSCGRGLPVLDELLGRTQDLIITPDGRIVPGAFFPHLFKEVEGVERFQVVQEAPDKLNILLQANRAFGEPQQAYLLHHIHEELGEAMQVRIEPVEQLVMPPSGKQRVTVSQIRIDFGRLKGGD